ncbi:hypothetical protein PENTCL1PPCAC_6911 [Pristionchus entomophagus]|uniref:FAD dependent oxidoreductase domain-containing protein n=1 Tax=Pristionchus entomophagus TaxID=358040 RepID=A0AAV5SNF5_9BILA|nr:hypothetical protein PENTCL1PPCAC_6911 [Pristionchus entomophagus]
MSNIVVIGAGIVGISSALAVQRKYPHAKVTIVADQFSPNLTSDVAAGFWWPYLVKFHNPDLLNRICRDTFDYISSLVEREDAGAMWQSGHEVSREETEIPFWSPIVREYRRLSPSELADRFPHQEYKSGQFFTTLALEPTIYISYATREFITKGGLIRQGKVKNLNELAGEFDVIINCCGIGARELVGDEEVSPIRGQIIRVRAPRVKHFFCDQDYYCLLNSNCVILGGTHDEGEWDMEVNEETAKRIMDENVKRMPVLKGAEVISHHVGLRPFRTSLRIEKETIRNEKGKETTIIHNYGHGGSGITLFWGCALHVVELLDERSHL